MVISAATFIENIIIFIRDTLRSNVTDPLNRGIGGGFVMTSYPKRTVQYPIITVKQTNVTTSKLGMRSEAHLVDFTLEVRVWARNAKEADELSSDVIQVLRTFQFGSDSTDDEEIYGFDILSMNPLVEDVGDNSVHSKIMEVLYRAILS